ncbi:MAG: hypothetical protein Q9227_006487 [Pyrenula ochraceoflavens]
MSKSDTNPLSTLLLTDPPSRIHRKVSQALTDNDSSITYSPTTRPGISNLLDILRHLQPNPPAPKDLADEFNNMDAGVIKVKALKSAVEDAVQKELGPIREAWEELMRPKETDFLRDVADRGKARAQESAEKTMVEVRRVIGL